eukprot:scaffold638_cov168-Amphora_coffeaeformis.AAC.30
MAKQAQYGMTPSICSVFSIQPLPPQMEKDDKASGNQVDACRRCELIGKDDLFSRRLRDGTGELANTENERIDGDDRPIPAKADMRRHDGEDLVTNDRVFLRSALAIL